MAELELNWQALREACDRLAGTGLISMGMRWGVTQSALCRGAGAPQETLCGEDGVSRVCRYAPPDGGVLWTVLIYGPDDSEGIARFTDDYILATPAIIERAKSIETWLDENPDAYDVFEPIRWSKAPVRAAAAKAWFKANRARWSQSPLVAVYADLLAEINAAIEGGGA